MKDAHFRASFFFIVAALGLVTIKFDVEGFVVVDADAYVASLVGLIAVESANHSERSVGIDINFIAA